MKSFCSYDQYDAGIGLTSVRGTGTSGYVQTNKFSVRKRSGHRKNGNDGDDSGHQTKKKSANKDIIEHNKKREIEVKVMEYRISLEDDDDVEDSSIEGLVAKYRQELLDKDEETREHAAHAEKNKQETHEIAARKEKKMEIMRNAMGFSNRDMVEGEAFDQELQQRRKEERIAERRRKEEERIEEERIIEKKRRKMHKAGYYEKDERPERYAGDQCSSEYSDDSSSENDASPQRS